MWANVTYSAKSTLLNFEVLTLYRLRCHRLLFYSKYETRNYTNVIPHLIVFMARPCVGYNQTLSDYAQLHAGVPQGIKIGPITWRSSMMQLKAVALIIGNMDDLAFAKNRTCNGRDNRQAALDEFMD